LSKQENKFQLKL